VIRDVVDMLISAVIGLVLLGTLFWGGMAWLRVWKERRSRDDEQR
jgi:hypothetical protein